MNEIDGLKYFMVAEKVGSLIISIEMTLEFIEEFKIVSDDEVRKALRPGLEKMIEWIK
jgi:hypothetical protein